MSAPLETPIAPFWLQDPPSTASAEDTAWPAERLDVRFDSEEALHRAVALLDGQTWVEDCRIDLGERTLHLRLAGGAAAAGFTLAPGSHGLH